MNEFSYQVSQIIRDAHKSHLVIAGSVSDAVLLHSLLNALLPSHTMPIRLFADWETLPYDYFSPHQDIISDRLNTLAAIQTSPAVLVCSVTTLMHYLPSKTFISAYTFQYSVGDTIDLDAFKRRLAEAGYRSTREVMQHGEFAIRGSIIDFFPMGSATPYRIDLFDDAIEGIKQYDPETQLTHTAVDRIDCLPANEFPLNKTGVRQFRESFRERFDVDHDACPVYTRTSRLELAPGIQYYLPLFHASVSTLFDHLPSNTKVILSNDVNTAAHAFHAEVQSQYESKRFDRQKPLLPPAEVFVEPKTLDKQLSTCSGTGVDSLLSVEGLPTSLKQTHIRQLDLTSLNAFIHEFPGAVFISAQSLGRREQLADLLREAKLTFDTANTATAMLDTGPRNAPALIVAPFTKGFIVANKVAVITESDLFDIKPEQATPAQPSEQHTVHTAIHHLGELKNGDPVIHKQHGIGTFEGLTMIETNDQSGEYICLRYADDDKIYVPIAALDQIQHHVSAPGIMVSLNKLGSNKWQTAKEKAYKKIRDVAAELLDVYSKRRESTGYAFKLDADPFSTFCEAFPFTETVDQANTIRDILADMTSDRTMDRLVCGDVGFGKTEVAMRAAFVAVQNHKQVAILVPTTLLASQHLTTFRERFAAWPIKIDSLSRFNTAAEQAQTMEHLYSGHLDMVIGTHKLLSKDIQFKNLGLLIVDEEHQFGVRHKERIKTFRAQANIDILTLTATPIPRTLNFAFSGLRDLSIIATPPEKRLSIKTFHYHWSTSLVKEAITRELMRGGQVFYLHNDVAGLPAEKEKLEQLMPDINIAIAHGQMRESELEIIMRDFYQQKYHVLLATTIIESGIDIPNANTIIINKAHKFGLAQLHQLRGRVGRSHHQAYAYLLTPPDTLLTKEAEMRLKVMVEHQALGIGFTLATHDLEIRGAGEILGEDQSGHIESIGFTLYMELLDKAVAALQNNQGKTLAEIENEQVEIELPMNHYIPSDYLADTQLRLKCYKRISDATTTSALKSLQIEMIDRFGLLPPEVKQLYAAMEVKLMAKPLGVTKIDGNKRYLYVHFTKKPNIDMGALIKLVQLSPRLYALTNRDTVRLSVDDMTPDALIDQLKQLLEKITPIKTG